MIYIIIKKNNMKQNYYKTQTNNRRKQNTHRRRQTNYRKGQTRKLNYKKVFISMLILVATIYFFISGMSNLLKKDKLIAPSTQVISEPTDITINMSVVGDIMCHSTNFADAYNSENETYDFSKVFADIKQYISEADIAIGNLETTFAGEEIGYSGYPTFNTPAALAQNLSDLGIDVLSTANNHSLDKRYNGLVSTLDELDKVGISHTGTYRSQEEQNNILIKNVNGINIVFLSFTYGTNGIPVPNGKEYCINLIDETLILDQLTRAKSLNPDLICVNMHWGDEYKLTANATQKTLADLLFKNGVDIILGSHPHVLESMEKRTVTLEDGTVKDGFLIYSLGNFMSGQLIEDTRNSIILQLKITKHSDNTITINSYNYVPTYMYDKGTGQKDRYKILDINNSISLYESGNSSISEDLYNKLKSSKQKIDNVLINN